MININKIISALLIFLIMFKCTSKSVNEYFNEAMLKVKEKKYEEAIKDFNWIIEKYPDDSVAVKSLYEIAKIYHAQLLPSLSKEESLMKATQYYKKNFNEYKNTPEAEKSLFNAGFIFANELNKLDSAKVNYELFLKIYPNSELIESVKLELENLGITPDEILNKKMKQENVIKD